MLRLLTTVKAKQGRNHSLPRRYSFLAVQRCAVTPTSRTQKWSVLAQIFLGPPELRHSLKNAQASKYRREGPLPPVTSKEMAARWCRRRSELYCRRQTHLCYNACDTFAGPAHDRSYGAARQVVCQGMPIITNICIVGCCLRLEQSLTSGF